MAHIWGSKLTEISTNDLDSLQGDRILVIEVRKEFKLFLIYAGLDDL